MKELNHHDPDPKSHSCSWLCLLAETQLLLFWPFMAQPLIRVLFLSLPGILTLFDLQESQLPLPRPVTLPRGKAPPKSTSLPPLCHPHTYPLPRPIHIQALGPDQWHSHPHWVTWVGCSAPLGVLGAEITSPTLVHSGPDTCLFSLWFLPVFSSSWGKLAQQLAKVPVLPPLQAELLNWMTTQLFSRLFQ